ncbi:MAG: cob(I)yrinic acid a,c-diamide adenosyltransferase [Acholeplasmataceae bacterium]|jgi:cob(I)alamin adenosyltransferase|nr:cob(I)yrinic acid a,c-diamide adenosyltransferase [Acholeplasmataceae bacterium]
MKIYTKRGDQGQTDLFNKRVSKADLHISVNGALDEAMAFILMAKHYIRVPEVIHDLDEVHERLFQIAYEIALNDKDKVITKEEHVLWMEKRLDYYDSFLEPLKKFIKLDQTKAASWLNVARVTIRRAEREFVLLASEQEVNIQTLAFINRLSDFLFTVARYFDEVK